MDPQAGTVSDIYPSLTYNDANAAIEWLCQSFGFSKRLVVPGPSESVMHSELTFGTGVVMVGSPRPDMKRFAPGHPEGGVQTLSVFVEDPDEHYARAIAAGAVIVEELKDEEYGARGYMAEDCEGHRWYFGNYRPGQYWETE